LDLERTLLNRALDSSGPNALNANGKTLNRATHLALNRL
jgi:hypothetical protein